MTFEEFTNCPLQGRVLGLDLGKKNIGVSLSDTRWCIASPFETLSHIRFLKFVQLLQQWSEKYTITLIVVGMPLNMDGSEGKQYHWNKQFIHNLRKKITLPFFLQDERLSTQAAYRPLIETGISYQKREEAIDKVAACYILQTALDRRLYFLQEREKRNRENL